MKNILALPLVFFVFHIKCCLFPVVLRWTHMAAFSVLTSLSSLHLSKSLGSSHALAHGAATSLSASGGNWGKCIFQKRKVYLR